MMDRRDEAFGRKLAASGLLSLCALGAAAAPVVTGFDGFGDGTVLSNQIAGVSFSNAVVIKAGISLNEFEFPPRSGDGVVFDDGGAIALSFAVPVFSVGGYFNYASGLLFQAFDSGNNLLGSATAAFASNLAQSGDPGSSPNELLSFGDASGRIASIVITGDIAGNSFTLDDLTVDAGNNSVPEPQTLALVLGVLGIGGLRGGWLRPKRTS